MPAVTGPAAHAATPGPPAAAGPAAAWVQLVRPPEAGAASGRRAAGRRAAGGRARSADDNAAEDMGPQRPDTVPTFEFKDPGFDVRPGFLCDPQSRKTPVAHGFIALTPRPKSVDPAAGKAPLTARR
mmetsp:Transcript_43344/g.139284  ORF Transcript_43344/g.139284 Transcript_43344/m.139284 type:complete len:127 (+) Transcript_43344:877-1257(+)